MHFMEINSDRKWYKKNGFDNEHQWIDFLILQKVIMKDNLDRNRSGFESW